MTTEATQPDSHVLVPSGVGIGLGVQGLTRLGLLLGSVELTRAAAAELIDLLNQDVGKLLACEVTVGDSAVMIRLGPSRQFLALLGRED